MTPTKTIPFKKQFTEKSNSDQQTTVNKEMSEQDWVKFYKEKMPFLKTEVEYRELLLRHKECTVKDLELDVRTIEAKSYLAKFDSFQKEMEDKKAQEEKMKAEWEAMTPEQREEQMKKAKENLEKMQSGNPTQGIVYDGTNSADILKFCNGKGISQSGTELSFELPTGEGYTKLSMKVGQLIERSEDGGYIISE